MFLTDNVPNYGCGPVDFECTAMKTTARTMYGAMVGMARFAADSIKNAFTTTPLGKQEWAVGDAQFWFWVAVIGLLLVVLACWRSIPALLTQDHQRLARIWIGLLFAVPVATFGVYAMHQLSGVVDGVTGNLLTALQGTGGMTAAVLKMVGVNVAPDGSVDLSGMLALTSNPAGAESAAWSLLGQMAWTCVLCLLLALASVVLLVMMGIRAVGLVALAAVAPIALMMWGQPAVSSWTKRWINLVIGLLLAKPLAAAVLLVLVELLGGGTPSYGIWLAAFGGLFVAACAPMWAVGLVNLSDHNTSHGWGSQSGATRIHQGGRAARSAVRLFGK